MIFFLKKVQLKNCLGIKKIIQFLKKQKHWNIQILIMIINFLNNNKSLIKIQITPIVSKNNYQILYHFNNFSVIINKEKILRIRSAILN